MGRLLATMAIAVAFAFSLESPDVLREADGGALDRPLFLSLSPIHFWSLWSVASNTTGRRQHFAFFK